jgi:hypothetical protein
MGIRVLMYVVVVSGSSYISVLPYLTSNQPPNHDEIIVDVHDRDPRQSPLFFTSSYTFEHSTVEVDEQHSGESPMQIDEPDNHGPTLPSRKTRFSIPDESNKNMH